MVHDSRANWDTGLELARVLVVDDDPASRLTLQTVLEAGGYRVDGAATAAEAVGKMDNQEYELILSDLQMESPEAGLRVIAHAHMMTYEPATALVTTWQNTSALEQASRGAVLIEMEDIPELLTHVADLIGERALRMLERDLRRAMRN